MLTNLIQAIRERRANRYFTRRYGLALRVSLERPRLMTREWIYYLDTRYDTILAATRTKFHLPETWMPESKL